MKIFTSSLRHTDTQSGGRRPIEWRRLLLSYFHAVVIVVAHKITCKFTMNCAHHRAATQFPRYCCVLFYILFFLPPGLEVVDLGISMACWLECFTIYKYGPSQETDDPLCFDLKGQKAADQCRVLISLISSVRLCVKPTVL